MVVGLHSVGFPEILNKSVAGSVGFVGQTVVGHMELVVAGNSEARHLHMVADHIPEVAKSFAEGNSAAAAAVGKVVAVNSLVAVVVGSLEGVLGHSLERKPCLLHGLVEVEVLPIAVVRLGRKVDMIAGEGTVGEVVLLLVGSMAVDYCMGDIVTWLRMMFVRNKGHKRNEGVSRRTAYSGGLGLEIELMD